MSKKLEQSSSQESTVSSVDFLVKISVAQALAKVLLESVQVSGMSLPVSSLSSNQSGSSSKTVEADLTDGWTTSAGTSKLGAIKRCRSLFLRKTRALLTGGTGFLSWPTPTAMDMRVSRRHGYMIRGQLGHYAHGRGLYPPRRGDTEGWKSWTSRGGCQPGILRSPNGLLSGMDRKRLKAIGNAVAPGCSEIVGYAIRQLVEENAL